MLRAHSKDFFNNAWNLKTLMLSFHVDSTPLMSTAVLIWHMLDHSAGLHQLVYGRTGPLYSKWHFDWPWKKFKVAKKAFFPSGIQCYHLILCLHMTEPKSSTECNDWNTLGWLVLVKKCAFWDWTHDPLVMLQSGQLPNWHQTWIWTNVHEGT